MSGGKISRRKVIGAGLVGAGLAGAGLIIWPDKNRPQSAPPVAGGIRVAVQSLSTSDTLDPAKGGTAGDYTRHFMLYSGLTVTGPDLIARPSLAETVESADRTTWSITLKRGVRFHDGTELTSADVVWSLRRHADPALGSKMATIVEQFADVRADGRYGVIVRLNGANADLPAILSQSHFLIVRDGQAEPDGNGTGPFRLAQFRPGERTVVTKNPDYFITGRPRLEQIELISIPDETSRVNALLAGDVQLILGIDPRSTPRIERSGSHEIMATPSSLYTNLAMRQDELPTSNPDFVAAIKYLVDRPLIKRALFRDFATLGNDQPIPPFHPYFNPDVPQTVLDLDKARWHLARSGLTGVRLPVYASPAAAGSVEMASILQEYASRVGLNLAVNRVPADGYWSTHWLRHPMVFGNVNPRPTADLIFSLFFKSDAEWNESGWNNPSFDRLLVEARGEADEVRRKSLYGEMQALVHGQCGVVIPAFITLIDGFDKRLKGLQPVPLGGLMGYQFAEHVWWEG